MKTKAIILKLLVVVVTIAIFTGSPLKVQAKNIEVTIAQSDSVDQIQQKIQTAIDGASANDTITVKGSKTNADGWGLSITIKAKVKVSWQAQYAGSTSNLMQLVYIIGDGNFEIVSGGSIHKNSTGSALYYGGKGSLIINGGEISNNSSYSTMEIAYGKAEIIKGTIRNNADGTALYVNEGATLKISGGLLHAKSPFATVQFGMGNKTVNVTGGTIENNGEGPAISDDAGSPANVNITISGGTIKSKEHTILLYQPNAKLTINGGSIVSQGGPALELLGDNCTLAMSKGSIKSGGNGIVVSGLAAKVNISGGSIDTKTQCLTILAGGKNTEVTISNGTLKSSQTSVGNILSNQASDVTLNIKGGSLECGNIGIFYGNSASNSKINISGGSLVVTGGPAIRINGTNNQLKISGGLVFSNLKNGAALIGSGSQGVIQMTGTPTISGKGSVVGFIIGFKTTYNQFEDEYLVSNTANGVFAVWNRKNGKGGIEYFDGSKDNGEVYGFIPIDGVTVDVKECTVKFESDGGTAIANKKLIAGEKLAKPTDPKKDGFHFGGWYSNATLTKVYNFNNRVFTDLTLYAKWTTEKETKETTATTEEQKEEVTIPQESEDDPLTDVDDTLLDDEALKKPANNSWLWLVFGACSLIAVSGALFLILSKKNKKEEAIVTAKPNTVKESKETPDMEQAEAGKADIEDEVVNATQEVEKVDSKEEKEECQENDSIFCSKCGKMLPADSKFCTKCGQEIDGI